MEQTLEQQVQEHINQLPKVTREVLIEFNWAERLQELGKRHGLLIDELDALQTETTLVLVGIEPAELFATNLRKHLDITNTETESIMKDINATIFQPIHDMVMERSEAAHEKHNQRFVAPKEATKTNNQILERDELLSQIEDAPETPKKRHTITSIKLRDMFTKKPAQTEHAVVPKKSTYEGSDPYLEPLE